MPYLIYTGVRDEEHHGAVVIGDAFAPTADERAALTAKSGARRTYKGRAHDLRLMSQEADLGFECGTFDVVVGNPPWQEAAAAGSPPRAWVSAFDLPAGENSFSQLFIHRALSMLRPGGIAGLLVGAKVLWNDRRTSRAFRTYLLERVILRQVVNMTHVRHVFFTKAVAPFAYLLIENRAPDAGSAVVVWNARRTGSSGNRSSMRLVQLDRRRVPQHALAEADYLWKTYWWGGHRDAAFVERLGLERTLGEAIKDSNPSPGYGWQRGSHQATGKVATLRELDVRAVQAFGPLNTKWLLPPPKSIGRDPDQRLYGGRRIVVTRGVKDTIGPIARLEDAEFTFRHSFYCIPIHDLSDDSGKLVLGMLWSSLGRYKLFMTAGSWGGWHDQVTAADLLSMPVRLVPSWGMPEEEHDSAARRVIAAVNELRALPTYQDSDFTKLVTAGGSRNPSRASGLIAVLNDAIFDLFELSAAERDLVMDFWTNAHDLFIRGPTSVSLVAPLLPPARQGNAADLAGAIPPGDLRRYLIAFLNAWNPQLSPELELAWQVAISPSRASLAVAFVPIDLGSKPPALPEGGGGRLCSAALRTLLASRRQPSRQAERFG